MEINMKESGKMVKCMAKESLDGKMGHPIMVNTKMGGSMAKEHFISLMEIDMKVFGKKAIEMAKE